MATTVNIHAKKITNNNQFVKLVEIMAENKDIARGFPNVGKSKQTVNEFWKELTVTLNSLGPPIREQLEWRKVWNDFKRNLKQKIAKIKSETRATGGGQNAQYALTPLEQEVDNILSLNKSGAPSGIAFGAIRDTTVEDEAVVFIEDIAGTSCISPIDEERINSPNNITVDIDTPIIISTRNTSDAGRKRKASTSITSTEEKRVNLLQQQTKTQKEIVDLLQKIEKNSYKLQYYTKKTYVIQEKKFKLMKDHFEKKQQNDLYKNKLALENIKIKQRKLELEERKLSNIEKNFDNSSCDE